MQPRVRAVTKDEMKYKKKAEKYPGQPHTCVYTQCLEYQIRVRGKILTRLKDNLVWWAHLEANVEITRFAQRLALICYLSSSTSPLPATTIISVIKAETTAPSFHCPNNLSRCIFPYFWFLKVRYISHNINQYVTVYHTRHSKFNQYILHTQTFPFPAELSRINSVKHCIKLHIYSYVSGSFGWQSF